MVFLEVASTAAQTADAFDFLNNFIFKFVEFIVIIALVVVAVILGAKLRKLADQVKANKEAKNANNEIESAKGTDGNKDN